MQIRKKYIAPLQKISQVSSPTLKKSQEAQNQKNDPLTMGQSYTSYFKKKQQKQQQIRKKNEQQIQLKQKQIKRYQDEVLDLKLTITKLEQELENYKYSGNCDSQILLDISGIVIKWIKHPIMIQNRKRISNIILNFFMNKKKNKRWLIYGQILIYLLDVYEIIVNQQ